MSFSSSTTDFVSTVVAIRMSRASTGEKAAWDTFVRQTHHEVLSRCVCRDIVTGEFQTPFRRSQERRIVVDNMHKARQSRLPVATPLASGGSTGPPVWRFTRERLSVRVNCQSGKVDVTKTGPSHQRSRRNSAGMGLGESS